MAGLVKGRRVSTALIVNEAALFTALRSALVAVLGCEVVKGMSNKVPQPLGDYVVMTPILMERMGTNESQYPVAPNAEVTRLEKTNNDYQIQLDFYGTSSGNNAAIIATMFRSDLLFQYGITPLFSSEPRQLMFKSGEDQMTERWSMDIHLHYNAKISLSQQSANQLSVTNIVEVTAI